MPKNDEGAAVVANIHMHMNPEVMSEEQVIRMSIEELEDRLAKLNETKINRNASEKIYAIYTSHIDVGFTSDQAWELLIGTLKGTGMMR